MLLTQRGLVNRLPECGTTVLCIDDLVRDHGGDDGIRIAAAGEWRAVRRPRLRHLHVGVHGAAQGGDGRAPGHRQHGLVARPDLTIHPDDRVLYNLPYTFDPSLCIIFPTLAAGARMVLADPARSTTRTACCSACIREKVTILEAPPAVLRLMLDDPLFAACRTLRWVCCGGEAMPPDLPRRLLDQLDVDLYNLYGPTEAAVDSYLVDLPAATTRGRPCRSAGRSPTSAPMFWTRSSGRSLRACRASCTSAGRGWPAAT